MPFHRPCLLLVLAGFLLLTACDSNAPSGTTATAESAVDAMAMDEDAMARMHARPPAEYARMSNPLVDSNEALAAGEMLFETNCANCHGPEGWGDGAAGASLDPAPAALARGMRLSMVSDGYLFWRISEGGAMDPFNSAMPAWKEKLAETERWQLVSFIRTLSSGRPSPDLEPGDHMGNGPMGGGMSSMGEGNMGGMMTPHSDP